MGVCTPGAGVNGRRLETVAEGSAVAVAVKPSVIYSLNDLELVISDLDPGSCILELGACVLEAGIYIKLVKLHGEAWARVTLPTARCFIKSAKRTLISAANQLTSA